MPTKQLYNIRIPRNSQTNSTLEGLGQNLEALSGLDSDQPVIEALGVQSGDHSIDASYANPRARVTAAELEELMQASGFDAIPYYTPSDPGRIGDGYIVIEDGSVEAASVHEDHVQTVTGTFTPRGTRGSHRRSLTVNPQQVHRNDFGNDTTAYVAIPSVAGKRTWYNREAKTREDVVVDSTQSGELVDVDIIDANTVSLTAPYELVHDVPYDDEYQVGFHLWDTLGYDAKVDADGTVQWQKTYRTLHEYSGVPVVDTRRLRLHLDEQAGLSYETWDDTNSTWTAQSLPASDWSLRDVDITGVSPVKIMAQCEFTHPSEGLFALNLIARRGRELVHWLVPESVSDPTPDTLVDYLSSIADPSVVRPQSSYGLVSRGEIRR